MLSLKCAKKLKSPQTINKQHSRFSGHNQLLTAKEYCIFIAAIDPVNKRVSLSSSCK